MANEEERIDKHGGSRKAKAESDWYRGLSMFILQTGALPIAQGGMNMNGCCIKFDGPDTLQSGCRDMAALIGSLRLS